VRSSVQLDTCNPALLPIVSTHFPSLLLTQKMHNDDAQHDEHSSPGSMRRTAVWILRELRVLFLLHLSFGLAQKLAQQRSLPFHNPVLEIAAIFSLEENSVIAYGALSCNRICTSDQLKSSHIAAPTHDVS
jgi:hypothetical protein